MPPSETPLPGRPVRGSATGRPIMALLDLLGRRWALRVLWELRSGPVPGFRELQSRCGGVSSSVLTDRLTELRDACVQSLAELPDRGPLDRETADRILQRLAAFALSNFVLLAIWIRFVLRVL